MKKELYDQMSTKEKLLYDEFIEFSVKLAARIEVLTQVIQKLLEVATHDP